MPQLELEALHLLLRTEAGHLNQPRASQQENEQEEEQEGVFYNNPPHPPTTSFRHQNRHIEDLNFKAEADHLNQPRKTQQEKEEEQEQEGEEKDDFNYNFPLPNFATSSHQHDQQDEDVTCRPCWDGFHPLYSLNSRHTHSSKKPNTTNADRKRCEPLVTFRPCFVTTPAR